VTVSVLIVSDYDASNEKGWNDLRKTLAALAAQDLSAIQEVLIAENVAVLQRVPPDIPTTLNKLRIVSSPATGSYELKNAGMRAATSEWVAVLDADCTPPPDWVGKVHQAIRLQPKAVVISGRTSYSGRTKYERILSLLSRAYLDPGRAAPTRFTSNNHSIWKREVYLRHPLPEHLGPFASRIQSERLLREGHLLWFDASLCVIHDFEGWGMERDIRWNAGFGTVVTRLSDPRMPYAWLTRLGRVSIPAVVAGKIWQNWRDCIRCASSYGVAVSELPLAMALSVLVHVWEAPGMWTAFQGGESMRTAYR
jgi:glycosyltransferase involved in cell wall biosynthesis